MSDLCFWSSFQLRMSRNAVLQVFKGVGVRIRQLYHARENNWTNYFLLYHASTK